MRKEDQLAQQIANYLNTQYPKVIYHFDSGSGARLSIGMAMRNKRLNKWSGYPDLFIAQPMNGYNGLFVELKTKTPFKKDGIIKSDLHLIEQDDFISLLKSKGYWAGFGIGFDETIKLIKWYLTPNGIFKNS
jgi:hypothetical protein